MSTAALSSQRAPHVASTDGSDSTFVPALLQGCDRAWRTFRDRFHGLIVSCVRKVTSKFGRWVSADDEADIVADFYLSLFTQKNDKIGRFDASRSQLSTWIGTLATHAAFDFLRRLRRNTSHKFALEAQESCSDRHVSTPFEQLAHEQDVEVAQRTMNVLSERDRQFAELYFLHEYTPNEIASRMKIRAATVYSKRHKIEARLRGEIRAYEAEFRCAS
jgi:RNA polymerase sigma factor (sigma-70 family)